MLEGSLNKFVFLVILVFIMTITYVRASVIPEFRTLNPIEVVIVKGVQPGPKLWRVSKNGNTLWILGSLSPLPKKMVWDAQSVKAILEDTQEFISPPYVGITISPFKAIFMLPSMYGLRNNPNKQTLEDVLPPELYTRWLSLKLKYMGKNKKVEKFRPLFAARDLFDAATKKIGLSSDPQVWKVINKSLKKHKIKITSTGVRNKIPATRKKIKTFKRSAIEDIACFEVTLDRLEFDLSNMRARALAWARGDVQALRSLPYLDQNKTCSGVFFASALGQDYDLAEASMVSEQQWLAAVRSALDANKVSFAMLPISKLLDSNGPLHTLKEQGYHVRGPKGNSPVH